MSLGGGCAALSGLTAGGCSRLSAHDLASMKLLTIIFFGYEQRQQMSKQATKIPQTIHYRCTQPQNDVGRGNITS